MTVWNSLAQIITYITQSYLDVLGRPPDPGGLQHYIQALTQNGMTREGLITDLRNSDEYQNKLKIWTIYVTITTNNLTGSAAHGLGKTPTMLGRPSPNQLEGLSAVATADVTNVTVTCNAPVSSDTIFAVSIQ